MKFTKLIMLLSLIIASIEGAFSASYDCNKATTIVEKQICNDQSLSALDEELSNRYAELLKFMHIKYDLIEEQRSWLKTSRNICNNPECIRKSYIDRIQYLENIYASMKLSFDEAGSKILSQRQIHLGMNQSDLVQRLDYGQVDYGIGAPCEKSLNIPDSENGNCIRAGYPLALYPEGCFSLSGKDGTKECEEGVKITEGAWLRFYLVNKKIIKIAIE